jgi:ankyrin repeat protein
MKKKLSYIIWVASVVIFTFQLVTIFRTKKLKEHTIELIEASDTHKLDSLLKDNPFLCNSRQFLNSDTFLIYAVEREKLEVVKLFLKHGANPNLHGSSRQTAIHIAVLADNERLLEVLVDNGADIESKGFRHENTALHLASYHGLSNMVEKLIIYGAFINSLNMQKETPLMQAVQGEHVQITSLLLKAGANLEFIDQRGRTALTMAKKAGNGDLINLLQYKKTGTTLDTLDVE